MNGARVFKSVYSQMAGVVFAGRNGLDSLELRLGAIRIPEVSLRIREAQRILDSLEVERVDLIGAIVSEDESFFRNIKIKSLLAAIVQVGLYDRLLKTQRRPEVLIGNSNGDSGLLVCAGQLTFEQLITTSSALQTLQSLQHAQSRQLSDPLKSTSAQMADVLPMGAGAVSAGGPISLLPGVSAFRAFDADDRESKPALPSLSGVSLTEYRAYMLAEDGGMVEVGQPAMDMKRLVADIVEHQAVTRFINVGPALALPTAEYSAIAETAGADEVTIIDSIDLDPMLNWFWKQVRPATSA